MFKQQAENQNQFNIQLDLGHGDKVVKQKIQQEVTQLWLSR